MTDRGECKICASGSIECLSKGTAETLCVACELRNSCKERDNFKRELSDARKESERLSGAYECYRNIVLASLRLEGRLISHEGCLPPQALYALQELRNALNYNAAYNLVTQAQKLGGLDKAFDACSRDSK
jgi:hypothetical protein